MENRKREKTFLNDPEKDPDMQKGDQKNSRFKNFQFNIIGTTVVSVMSIMAVLILSALAIFCNEDPDKEIAKGLTLRESRLAHNGMTEEEVRQWAAEVYGDEEYIIEVIPYENSMVTDHTGGKEWCNDFDPGVKLLVLDNGDTIVVVGPQYLDLADSLIEGYKKDYWEQWRMEFDGPSEVTEPMTDQIEAGSLSASTYGHNS